MNRDTMLKIMDLREAAWKTEGFAQLAAEHEWKNQRFLEACAAMTQAQQDAVFDYIGLLIEAQNRLLVFAWEKGGLD